MGIHISSQGCRFGVGASEKRKSSSATKGQTSRKACGALVISIEAFIFLRFYRTLVI
jgi:hypothetical protein